MTTQTKRPAIWQAQADADAAYEVYLDNAARSCILVFEHEGFEKAEFEKETRAIQISRWTGADFYQVCNDIDDAITELH